MTEDDTGLSVDITPIYGGFQKKTLQKMKNLITVDVSGCTDMDSTQFIDSLMSCIQIEKLEIMGCTQFSEYNIVDICTSLPNLTYIDATNCAPLQYVNANVILCNARNLKVFRVEVRYPDYELNDWVRLKGRFPHVYFGLKFQQMFLSK